MVKNFGLWRKVRLWIQTTEMSVLCRVAGLTGRGVQRELGVEPLLLGIE